MKSTKPNRKEFINTIVQRIEENFRDSVVLWRGTGVPDEDLDDTEIFEALWIRAEDYDRFEDFVWDLEENYAQPNGFSIMVHSASPKVTKELRWEEYKKAMSQRGRIKTKAKRAEKIRK